MVGVALLYDVLQALLDLVAMGWLLVPVAYLHFWLWFKMHGIKFFTPKGAKHFGIGVFFEIISLGILPGFTYNVLMVCLEYKIKNSSIIKK